jgi:UDP:flavonoid glycosyltransferase YjiC (YdhE family)
VRVLCSTTAGDGHFGPLKPLALACRAAGHDVLVAAPASYAGAVARAGLEHAAFADAPDEAMREVFAGVPALTPDDASAVVMREVFGRLDAQAALPGLTDVVEQWQPDVVLRDPAELGSLAAAEAAGVPNAEVAIGVAALMDWGRTHLAAPLAELDERVGLPHGHLLRASVTAPVFSMVPECMERTTRPTRRAVRYRTGPGRGPGHLPAPWGDPEAPLVYVTFGTVAAGLGHLRDLFATALGALADLPVRVLLTTGHAGGVVLEDVPVNAHVEKFWPQDDVMPLAAAVVGHGGFGTTMSALSAGVPQVVVPLFTTDQRLNAEAVADLGAGVCLPGGPQSLADLGAAVESLLASPEIRGRAGEVAAEVAALPTAAEVVDEIGRLTTTSG